MNKLTLLCLLLPLLAQSQFVTPSASPAARTTTMAGYTQLSVDYHRPNVRGRLIFGELIPWGVLWRAGADESTTLHLDGPATIGKESLEPGSYSLFLLPRETGGWTWVINKETGKWGTQDYRQSRDVVRETVVPRRLSERIQSLEYRWMNVTPQSADLVLEWEWYRLTLPIRLPTNDQVDDRATLQLNPASDPNEYYAAARYFFDNDQPRTAKAWIDRWASSAKEQFGRTRYQALIEYELGNETKAKRLMERSLELAREAGNDHYARMNEGSLRQWQSELVDIPVDTVIARSIAYHDPSGQWNNRNHLIQLAESRPDGTVRHTRLSLHPGSDDFDMRQTSGKDRIQLRYFKSSFSFSHNGSTDIDEATVARLGLNQKAMLRMRDYYSFLFGLPMKLRDQGTIIQPDVKKVWYHGQELLEVEVRYAPGTGQDVWQLYFHPRSFALSGYSFYHEAEGPHSGEYVLLEGEATVGSLKLPALRHWYLTKDRLYLGTDEILN
jgi:hypothetical protein